MIRVRLGSSPAGDNQYPLFRVSLCLHLYALISYHLPKVSARRWVILHFIKSCTSEIHGTAMARCGCKASMTGSGLFLLVIWGLDFFIGVRKELPAITPGNLVLPKIYTITENFCFLLRHLSCCLQGDTIGLWHRQVLIKYDPCFSH